jgi:hypothetical protein
MQIAVGVAFMVIVTFAASFFAKHVWPSKEAYRARVEKTPTEPTGDYETVSKEPEQGVLAGMGRAAR